MAHRKLLLIIAIVVSSCIRKPEQFWTPVGHDRSIIFPLSTGGGLVKVDAQNATYDLDGEVLRALMIAGNDYIPPGIPNPPCWARLESLEFRFTRRDDIIFVYVSEDFARCGYKLKPIHHGAKYAISKEGRILRRVIDGVDDDDHLWLLKTPDGGAVIVATESYVSPDLEDLDKPDSGVLKIITEPWDMPGTFVLEPLDSTPVREGDGVVLGMSFVPYDAGVPPDAGLDGGTPEGGTPGDAGAAMP